MDEEKEKCPKGETPKMPANTLEISPPHSLIGGAENMKLVFDRIAHDMFAAKPYPTAWEALALLTANNAQTNANIVNSSLAALATFANGNLAAFAHFVNMNAASAGQIGTTEGQAAVTPIRTGAADTQVQQPAGAVYPPIRNVDQTGAGATGTILNALSGVAAAVTESVQTNVTSQIGTLTTQVIALGQQLTDTNTAILALLAQLVQNAKQTPPATAA